ncbi:MAG TPA: tetratricopeptide repeat-containing glycosyltransferase family protein, partial [Steroidobacteraceae bacterium]|nr:tetratricopeptide repeat-containing glycosyltransferase family protein [Steroidobacteraceae bacterium]
AVQARLGRSSEALASYDRAIELEPCDEQSHLARSAALRALGRSEEAVASCEKLLERNPQCAEAHVNRAAALQELQRAEDALVSCERAIALQPDCAAAHLNRGISLHALDRTAEALASWDRVLQLDPQSAPAYLSRGAALQALQRPEEALASCERAIALQPDCAAAHLNRSGALRDLNRFEEALASIERAITLDPEAAPARFNAGVMQLQLGRFDPGWSLYENRLSALATSAWSHPFWRGRESIRDKSLFVHCEQGFGDTIQFCRYLTMAEAHGARVVLSVDDRLRRLLRSLSPTIRFLGPGERPERFDFHCPLLSLPRAFGTTIDTIPVMMRYLAVEADRVTHWRQRLGDEGFKIGICWQGNPRNPQDVGRSPPLEMFAPLATLPNVRLISLQREHGLEQLAAKPAGMTVEELGGEFEPGRPDSFLDAAAVMEGLDLVISGDTAIAHLAGALGRPTWVALRHVPEWRWLLDREDSPWYPTLRLFRQSCRGDWAGVFAAMRRALIHVRSDPAGSHAGSTVSDGTSDVSKS